MGFFQPLFTVSVEHQYFSSGLWRELDFIPTLVTSKIVAGADILVKATGSGIGVFYDEDRGRALQLYLADADGALHFSFKVHAKDRTFSNYTFPSTGRENSVLCFDSRANAVATESGTVRLSKAEFVSEADFRAVGELMAEGLLDDRDVRMPPDFIVNIVVEAADGDGFRARDYGVKFGARQSFWKYYLLGNMNRNNCYIVDLDNRIEFEACDEVVLPGNRPAKVFRSTAAVPLLEKSACRFQLRERGQGAGKVLVKRLPVASESRLGREMVDGRSVIVLENYVNC